MSQTQAAADLHLSGSARVPSHADPNAACGEGLPALATPADSFDSQVLNASATSRTGAVVHSFQLPVAVGGKALPPVSTLRVPSAPAAGGPVRAANSITPSAGPGGRQASAIGGRPLQVTSIQPASAATIAGPVPRRAGSGPPPVAILLQAESLEEARFIATHKCFTAPKALRKALTRQYRDAEQLGIFVAVGDILVARAVIASDVIPRAHAARSVPDLLSELPSRWTNVFRVTLVSAFDDEAMRLALPCPLSDRCDLPSQVDAGYAVSRIWNSTLLTFIDSTIAVASGKSEHYTELLEAVKASAPDAEVPENVRALVSPVKMVSHGPGVVMLAYIARYFGRAGREFVANCLFELNAGVIDLCRNTIGGGLISYLVRHGTCATPRILQLVPWRVVASRILSDAVGSQTASLMLHSALHFHRSTHRAVEPVALSSLTHRVLTKNFADAADPTNECSLTSIASNAQSCRVLQLVVEACVELLAMHAAGTLTTATDDIVHNAQRVVTALCDLADRHAADPWSNYATQSLITACTLHREDTPEAVAKGRYFDSLLARVMVVVRPHIVRLSCHKCGSNVIEKLCAARPNITTQVAAALLESPGAYPRLASDRYGNYVVQTLLQHLPVVLEIPVRDALLPVLATLDPHWQCAIAIDSWCKSVAERHTSRVTGTPNGNAAAIQNNPQRPQGTSGGTPAMQAHPPQLAASSVPLATGPQQPLMQPIDASAPAAA